MDAIIRKRLKTWQKEFRLNNGGREPRRSDIAKVPEIAAMYEAWTALSSRDGASASASSKESGNVGETSGGRRSSEQADSRTASDRHRERDRDRSSKSSNRSSRPPVPTTPTKARPAQDAIFKTPTKPASSRPSAASPSTPHRTTPPSSTRNPFKTPTKASNSASPAGPSTPSSAVKLRTPRTSHSPNANNPDGTSATQLDPSFHFDYNKSPSSFRTLVGQHSSSQSPNRRPPPSSIDADLQRIYTPRTKARKRLRGDEVPPTPESDRQLHAGRVASSSPSKSSSSALGVLQPGPVDPRPRKRRAERTLSAYWGGGGGDVGAEAGPSRFQRTVSQSQSVLPSSQRLSSSPDDDVVVDDDDDEGLIQASPSSKRGSVPVLPPSSPSTGQRRKRPAAHDLSQPPHRKFHSLFAGSVSGSKSGDVMEVDGGSGVGEEVEAEAHGFQQNGHHSFSTEKPSQHDDRPRSSSNIAPISQQEILVVDLSSSSESEDEPKGRRKIGGNRSGRGATATQSKAKSASPSKAAFIRTYRRLGALSLSRHHSGNDLLGGGASTDAAASDSDDAADGDAEDWNPSRFLAVSRAAGKPRQGSPREDTDTIDTPSTSHATIPARLLARQPSAMRTLHQAHQLHTSSVLSNLGLLDEAEASDSDAAAEIITLENAESALGVTLERSGFKACAEGQEISAVPSKPPMTWGAAKAANKNKFKKNNDEDDPYTPKDKFGKNLLGRAKRGWNGSLGTFVGSDEDEEDANEVKKTQQRNLTTFRSLVFKRTGRSGVDDDEFAASAKPGSRRSKVIGTRTAQLEDYDDDSGGSDRDRPLPTGLDIAADDEDWQSDVDSVDWGVGDGRMDDVDVM